MRLRWRRPRSTDDFVAEVHAHIDHEVDRLVAEGVPAHEARRLASRAFGPVVGATERFHEARRWCGLSLSGAEAVRLDLRYAVRMVARAPGLCAVVAVTLSLGLGVGASLITVFNGLFLRPNVTHDPSSFAKLFISSTGGDVRAARGEPWSATIEEFDALRVGSHTLVDVTASAWATFRVSGRVSGQLRGLWVSCNYLRAHVPVVVAGRTVSDDDCHPSRAPVAVLSARGWTRLFGAATDVVGRHVTLNGRAVEIVGVVGDGAVRDPVAAEVFLPYSQRPDAAHAANPTARSRDAWLSLSGRYARGATPAAVQREVQGLIDTVNGPRGRSSTARVTNGAAIFDPSAGKYLPMMVSAGAFALVLVLVLTCANAAMLLLARAVAREGEWAMRLRLGAPPSRLVRQALIEGAVLVLPAWLLAVALASWLPPQLLSRLSVFPLSVDLAPDWRVWGATGAMTVAAGILTAVAAARHAVSAPLTAGGATATPRSHAWLLTPQVAACVVFASGVATLSATDERWRAPRVAYDPADVVVATWTDEGAGVGATRALAAATDAAAQLRDLPGVAHTALASPAPFSGDMRMIVRHGQHDAVSTSLRVVSAEYFALAHIDVVAGRPWHVTPHTSATKGSVEAVVSLGLSHRLGGLTPPARLELHDGRTLTVIGVVADTVSIRPDATDGPLLYLPAGAAPTPATSVLVRGGAATAALVRARWPQSSPTGDPAIESLSTILARSGGGYRTGRDILALVAALALGVSVVGTAGAVAFQLRRRRRETAVRLVLGATRVGLLAHHLVTTLTPVLTGVLLGAGVALLLGLAWRPTDAGFVGALRDTAWPGLVVTVVSALAAAIAAIRALKAASLTALRED